MLLVSCMTTDKMELLVPTSLLAKFEKLSRWYLKLGSSAMHSLSFFAPIYRWLCLFDPLPLDFGIFFARGFTFSKFRAHPYNRPFCSLRLIGNSNNMLMRSRDPSMEQSKNLPQTISLISPRELTVLELIALGSGYREIGEQMNISCETVRTHRKNLMRKLEACNGASLVRAAFEAGLLAHSFSNRTLNQSQS